jgi:hypothetical protein
MQLNYNGLYSFHYKPKTQNLSIYDRCPLVFLLDINSKSWLAINMHWIPKTYRDEFIVEVKAIMAKTLLVGKKRERCRLTYILLKQPKYKRALLGIRRYLFSNISKLHSIPEARWDSVLTIKKYRASYVTKELKRHGIKESDFANWHLV